MNKKLLLFRIAVLAAVLIVVGALIALDLTRFVATPVGIIMLFSIWKQQAIAFFTRKEHPLIFWGAIVLFALVATFGLLEYRALIEGAAQ